MLGMISSGMGDEHPDYLGLYGSIKIPKSYCQKCLCYSFVIEGKIACCGADCHPMPLFFKRESFPPYERRALSKEEKTRKLIMQGYRCFWCRRAFWSIVKLRKREIKLKIHWDHLIPWVYNQNNQIDNYVAACHICNLWKQAMVFSSIEAGKVYLGGKWDEELRKDREE